MTRVPYISFILLISAFQLVSCKRSELNNETTSSQDNAMAEALWDDVEEQVTGTASIQNPEGAVLWNNCASLTVDTIDSVSIYPLVFTINFGETNCEGADGKLRRGVLIYKMTGPYKQEGTTIEVSTDDYYVNNIKIEGTRTTENLGNDSNGYPSYAITILNGLIILESGESISWNCNRTRTWIEGSETGFFTPDSINGGFLGWEGIKDDVYEIEGFSDGINRDGRVFSAEITSALRLQLDCSWITSGVVELIPEELRARVIDYGDGTCDNKATITVGERTEEVSLGN